MVLKGKIPKEIFDFISRDAGRSLLVRGPAGTGKTTFALETMEKMRREMNTYYLTSRVADSALFDHFVWLKQMVDEGEMMKVVKEMEKLALKKDAERKGPRVERAELKKLEGFIEGDFGEPLFDQKEVTLTVGSQIAELDLVYDVVEKALPKSTLVVIDSVEGVCEKYGISPTKLIYTLEKDLVESAHAKVIFVVETPEPMLDYLADGVVHLEMRNKDNRTLRCMEIKKLRGMRIDRSNYLYTLEGGRFTVLEPPRPDEVLAFNNFGEEGKNPFVTEIAEVDNVLGSIGQGVVINVISDEHTTLGDQYLFLKKIMAWHFIAGRGIFYMPSKTLDPKETIKFFATNTICTERFPTHLRMLVLHTFLPQISESQENLVLLEGTNIEREITADVIKSSMNLPPPYLFIIDAEALYSTYRNLSTAEIMGLIRLIRSINSNCIFITYPETPQAILQLSDISIRLRRVESVPVIAGEFPHTPYYGFSIERYVSSPRSGSKPEQKRLKIRLIPIV
ncbi:MAG: RAD55 family ATPase [Thermoplasmata archaeon]